MKECIVRLIGAVFDLEVIVALCGIVLSVFMHELFHFMVHFGEVKDINLFPDSHAIVEILFSPTRSYDLAAEEAIAYGVTMITLLLTAMLIFDIHNLRDTRSIQQIINKEMNTRGAYAHEYDTAEHLARILGVATTAQ